MIQVCLHCQKSFDVRPAKVREGKGKYCSRACLNASQTSGRVMQTCLACGKSFETWACYVERGQMEYCSRECAKARAKPPEERFWGHVDVCVHGRACETCCWPWTGAHDEYGYGKFGISKADGSRSTKTSHTYAWENVNGPMPVGKQGNHICIGNPACSNPAHIYAGTKRENTADAMQQGHMRELLTPERTQGEENVKAKLTEEEVLEIRKMDMSYRTYTEVARLYGVTRKTISDIQSGLTWKHI